MFQGDEFKREYVQHFRNSIQPFTADLNQGKTRTKVIHKKVFKVLKYHHSKKVVNGSDFKQKI